MSKNRVWKLGTEVHAGFINYWTMRTTYNNWLVEVRIKHNAINHDVSVWGFHEGDEFELVTRVELQRRRELAKEHGDVYYTTNEVVMDEIEPLRVDAVDRFKAIQYIVEPDYTM